VQDGSSQGQPLSPSSGQVSGKLLLTAHQPGHAQDVLLAFSQERRGDVVRPAEEVQVFVNGEIFVETELLAHVAHSGPDAIGFLPGVVSQHDGPSCAGLQEAQEHADGCGLPGAVGAQEAEDLPPQNPERDAIHGQEMVEALTQVLGHDGVGVVHDSTSVGASAVDEEAGARAVRTCRRT